MKITRYFLQHEDEDTGVIGWIPMWIPKSANFDPMGALGMMHDSLEHRLCDRGLVHEEMMAFGRIAAIRGMNVMQDRAYYSREESLGTELGGLWFQHSRDTAPLQAPETTPLSNEGAEVFLCKVADHCVKTYQGEADGYGEGELEDPDAACANALAWLRIGFLDATRRYGDVDHGCFDLGLAAQAWADKNVRSLYALAEEEVDSALRLVIDTKKCKFEHTLIRRSEYSGFFPQWLQNRYWAWSR